MSSERFAPGLSKIAAAWDDFENSDRALARVLANMKTAGPNLVPVESGRTPEAN